MDGDDLKTGQAKRLYAALWPGLNYLLRLRTRMEKVGFRQDDPLYLLVVNAYDAVHRLTVDLHYRSCDSGVGQPAKDQ